MNPGSIVCICGAGTMGSGIAQAAAASGFYTILYELNDTVLEKAKASVQRPCNHVRTRMHLCRISIACYKSNLEF